MEKLIASVSQGVPAALSEVVTLGRTLKKRAADVLAYFDRPAPATVRLADSSTCAAQPSGSAISPTTSPDRCWRPAASEPNYTLDREEPHKVDGSSTVASAACPGLKLRA